MSEDRFKKLLDCISDDGNFFSLTLNMNDVFGWACAESGEMGAADFGEVYPIWERLGHTTFIAYEVIRRKGEGDDIAPAHGRDKDPNYLAAKKELEALAADGTILYEHYYRRMKGKPT